MIQTATFTRISARTIKNCVKIRNVIAFCYSAYECCCNDEKVYQPKDNKTSQLFTNKNHRFLQAWYDKYKWITI